jgi:hypothetical protein
VAKMKKKKINRNKEILLKTSDLFKGEKQKRKHKYEMFKKKFSLFDKKKSNKMIVKISTLRKSKIKRPSLNLTGGRTKHRRIKSKENITPPFNKRRKSEHSVNSSTYKFKSKRNSVVNISRAYSKFKHSFIDSQSRRKGTSTKKSRKSTSKLSSVKRKPIRTSGKKRKNKERSETNQGRSKFIEIDKGGGN